MLRLEHFIWPKFKTHSLNFIFFSFQSSKFRSFLIESSVNVQLVVAVNLPKRCHFGH